MSRQENEFLRIIIIRKIKKGNIGGGKTHIEFTSICIKKVTVSGGNFLN